MKVYFGTVFGFILIVTNKIKYYESDKYNKRE